MLGASHTCSRMVEVSEHPGVYWKSSIYPYLHPTGLGRCLCLRMFCLAFASRASVAIKELSDKTSRAFSYHAFEGGVSGNANCQLRRYSGRLSTLNSKLVKATPS